MGEAEAFLVVSGSSPKASQSQHKGCRNRSGSQPASGAGHDLSPSRKTGEGPSRRKKGQEDKRSQDEKRRQSDHGKHTSHGEVMDTRPHLRAKEANIDQRRRSEGARLEQMMQLHHRK